MAIVFQEKATGFAPHIGKLAQEFNPQPLRAIMVLITCAV
jgi:hypothetical protein